MQIPIYQIDAFTQKRFGGNPAAVCPLPYWPDDALLQNIAIENNLAETGFFVDGKNGYEIRWFMPHAEIDLCGHATLASAYVLFHYRRPGLQSVAFSSKSGTLHAKLESNGSITLDFPSWKPEPVDIPPVVLQAFANPPQAALAHRDLILRFANEEEVVAADPDFNLLKSLPYTCIAITAPGISVDFVSRVFDPQSTQIEDPVTGSTHSILVPYWAEQLNKTELKAAQLSRRGGELFCRLQGERVYLSGFAVPYLVGTIEV